MQAIAHIANQLGLKSVATFIGTISEIFSEEQIRLSRLPTPPSKPEQPPTQTTSAENRESTIGLYELLEGSSDPKPVANSDMTGITQLAQSFGLIITPSRLGGYVLNTMTYFDTGMCGETQHLLGAYARIELDEAHSSLKGSLRKLVIIGFLTDSESSKKDYYEVTETAYEHQILLTFSWRCFPEMPWCELRKLVHNRQPIETIKNIAHQSTVFDSSPPVKSNAPEANPDSVFQLFQQSMSSQRRT